MLCLVLVLLGACHTVEAVSWSSSGASFSARTAVVGVTSNDGARMLLAGGNPSNAEVWTSSMSLLRLFLVKGQFC